MSTNDFGGMLRQAREQRGLSLRQIATTTKIAVPVLEALERNDFSRLPSGIFSRGFVRSYAIEVGLEPEATVREFLERLDAEPPPSAAVPHALLEEDSTFERQKRTAAFVLKLVVVGLVVVVILLYFILRDRGGAPSAELRRVDQAGDQLSPATVAHVRAERSR